MITLRRVYDPGKSGEHYKVLVDRLWPRGTGIIIKNLYVEFSEQTD